MITIILVAVFAFSLIGVGIILYRKIPELADLPETHLNIKTDFLPKIKKGVGKLPGAKNIDYELYLQKMLSRVRVLTLKTESKTGNWLEKLRQRSNNKNNHKQDAYWDELKRGKEGK